MASKYIHSLIKIINSHDTYEPGINICKRSLNLTVDLPVCVYIDCKVCVFNRLSNAEITIPVLQEIKHVQQIHTNSD